MTFDVLKSDAQTSEICLPSCVDATCVIFEEAEQWLVVCEDAGGDWTGEIVLVRLAERNNRRQLSLVRAMVTLSVIETECVVQ